MGFQLISEDRLDPEGGPVPESLVALHAYWLERCRGRAMPARADVDPADLRSNLGRVHLLDVEGPETFRYRVYGSRVTNPDAADMTGRTTLDYKDRNFAELVTRHYAECVGSRRPCCRAIRAALNDEPYEYTRLTLPLSDNGETVTMILVGTVRHTVPDTVKRVIGGLRRH